MSGGRAVAGLTWRLLLGRRRWMALVVCNGLPVFIAWLFALERSGLDPSTDQTFTIAMMRAIVVTTLLPLSAVVFGTSAFGNEIDDGTLTYLLAKPTARWRVVVAKWAAAAGATAAANVPGVVIACWILMGDLLDPLGQGFAVGVLVASIVYTGLFLALGLYTRRALIIGLIYVLGWEGALSRLFAGTRTLSVREYTVSLAGAVADRSASGGLMGSLTAGTALAMSTILAAIAVALAIRKLRRIELTERV